MRVTRGFIQISCIILFVSVGESLYGQTSAKQADKQSATTKPAAQIDSLYPEIEPFKTGTLKVSDLHEIYYELCGNPKGIPVMMLHGGPGSGCYPTLRRFHDPKKYLIVLHDQRGAGRSKPFAELKENTTQNLVEDIEKLRKHLELGKVQLFGGSWGSTLALAYGETYPQNVSSIVMRGIFTGRKWEIDHFYHGPVSDYFPDAYKKLQAVLPHPERKDYPRQLLDMMTGDDAAIRDKAARAWAAYETKLATLECTDEEVEEDLEKFKTYFAFSLIENYYMANNCFVDDDQLLRNAGKLNGIPTVIVHGRYDVICAPVTAFLLNEKITGSRLVIVPAAGHSGSAPPMIAALVGAVKWVEPRLVENMK